MRILKHNLKKINILGLEKKLLVVCCVFFVTALVARLYTAGQVSTMNNELKEALETKKNLDKELTLLVNEDIKLSALSAVESRARRLGFVDMAGKIFALNPYKPASVASLPAARP